MAKYTVSTYPRDNLTAKTVGLLDALAANPATANLGVNSGYRSPEKNAKAGGASKSQHIHGNAVDLDISGLTTAQKQEALRTAIAAGAKGIGVYPSGNSLHIDPRANAVAWGPFSRGKYKGALPGEWARLPAWARETFAGMNMYFDGVPLGEQLPDTMQAPSMLADVQMREEAQRAVTAAYSNPTRALDVVLSKPPSSFPSRVEVPGALPAARPSTFRPENIDRALVGANPAPSTAGALRPSMPSASRFGYGTVNAVRPSAPTVGSMPAARPTMASTFRPENISRSLTGANPPAAVDRSVAPANPGQLGGITMSNPKGDFSVGPTTAELAAQYGQYRTPTNYQQVRDKMNPPPAQPPVPDFVPPAPNILAPLMPQVPTEVKQYNVASVPQYQAPPAAPAPTAYDVYSGKATQAKDNTGQNTVGMLPDGTTTVTNKYGVTTGMTPYGKQTAVGNIPGVPASFGRQVGKMAMPAVGSLAFGPLGGLLGALAAYGLSRPGGLLSNVKNVDTSMIAGMNPTTQFYKPDSSLRSFPSAPSGGYRGSASFSNRSAEGMRGISPRAADAIGRGQGGLY